MATDYSYTLTLSTTDTPNDCGNVTDDISSSASSIDSLTMNPGDTLNFSVTGSFQKSDGSSGSVTDLLGVHIKSCTLGGNDVDASHFFGDQDNTSLQGVDCRSSMDYTSLPLTAQDSAHSDNTVTIVYEVWMKSNEKLADGNYRSFYYKNSLTLATVTKTSTVTISGTGGKYTLASSPSYFDIAPYGKLNLTINLKKARDCDVNDVRFLLGNGSQAFIWYAVGSESGSPSNSSYQRNNDTKITYDETNPGGHSDEKKYHCKFKAEYKQDSTSSWTPIQTSDPTICNEGT